MKIGIKQLSMRKRKYFFVLIVTYVLTLMSCNKSENEKVQRGRTLYNAQCITCHNTNPALEGPLGPPVSGSSIELLKTKILQGNYPEKYTPKRDTRLMPKLPLTEEDISALAEFLK